MVNRSHYIIGHAFPGQNPGEVIQFYFRQHWIRLIRPVGRMLLWLSLLAIALSLALQIDQPGQEGTRRVMIVLLLVFFLFSQFEFMNEFYRHFLYTIVVTNRKVHRIKKTLFAIDEHQSVELSTLQDVHKAQHGVMQNLLGFGSLTIEAMETVLCIHFVPCIEEKCNAILHLRGASPQPTLTYTAERHDRPSVEIHDH